MLFNSKRNFKDHMMHALVGFFVGAAIMSLLSSKSAEVSAPFSFLRLWWGTPSAALVRGLPDSPGKRSGGC